MSFKNLGLIAPLVKNTERLNYAAPYPIQAEAIPAILKGHDVLAIAKTGSGKTASFVLPILQQFQKKAPAKNRQITALVLVPTRELAMQVEEVVRELSYRLPRTVKSLAVYGGVSINPQMMQLQGVEFLVATPGRLLDLIGVKAIDLSALDILVLDEADKMLNLGFKKEMTELFELMPAKRQNLLFSATLRKDIQDITEFLLHNAVKIEIAEEDNHLDLIQQSAYHVNEDRKGPLLRKLIIDLNLQQVLVFTSSTHRADKIVDKLHKHGIQALTFHAKNSQAARVNALERFKKGDLRVLVATDLASRGIDIQFLPVVINYELPRSPKDYVHRIGRTGRAENAGQAISFISEDELHHFKVIQKKMGKEVEILSYEL